MDKNDLQPETIDRAKTIDSLLFFHREAQDMVRNQDVQRAAFSRTILTLTAGLFALLNFVSHEHEILVQNIIFLLIFVVGFIGNIVHTKIYERTHLLTTQAKLIREALDEADPALRITQHYQQANYLIRRKFPIFSRLGENSLWQLIYVFIMILGVSGFFYPFRLGIN